MLRRGIGVLALFALAGARAETLAVYLDQPVVTTADASLRTELSRLLSPSGLTVDVRGLNARSAGQASNRLMVIRLKGLCAANPAERVTSSAGPLASTHVDGDRVLPFAQVHCDRTLQAISQAISTEPPYRRDALFGRALARVIAHEIFHFLAQDKGHAATGVAKSCLGVRDLLTESFAFDAHTVNRIRETVPAVALEGDESTER